MRFDEQVKLNGPAATIPRLSGNPVQKTPRDSGKGSARGRTKKEPGTEPGETGYGFLLSWTLCLIKQFPSQYLFRIYFIVYCYLLVITVSLGD